MTLHSATSSASLWWWQPGVGVPLSRTVLWPQDDRQLGGRTACIHPAGLQVGSQLVKVIGWTVPLEIPMESHRKCGVFPQGKAGDKMMLLLVSIQGPNQCRLSNRAVVTYSSQRTVRSGTNVNFSSNSHFCLDSTCHTLEPNFH